MSKPREQAHAVVGKVVIVRGGVALDACDARGHSPLCDAITRLLAERERDAKRRVEAAFKKATHAAAVLVKAARR